MDENSRSRSDLSRTAEYPHPATQIVSRRPSWWSRAMLDNWAWEIGAAVLCLGILVAIAGILFAYDHHEVPDLPDGLTINAIISFLATLAHATLMVILAAALRQEKWLWFIDQPRPLNTVDTFEEASRGPYGSLLLLASFRGSLRALLAAFVTILALGFEPLIQQLVLVQVREVPINSTPASIRTPTSYEESVIGNLGGSSLSLNALIGAFGGAAGAIPDPICPSGNCTWPAYNTLALCTVCQDVTDQVLTSGEPFNINLTSHLETFAQSNDSSSSTTWSPTYALPHGNNLTVDVTLDLDLASSVQWFISYPRRSVWPLNIDRTADSDWASTWDNETYAGIPSPLFAMGYIDTIISADYSALTLQNATECSFTPCVRTMDTEVRSGVTRANITATNYGHVIIYETQPDGQVWSGWNALVNGTTYSMYDHGTFDVQGHAYLLIQALRIALEGNTTYSIGGYWYPDPEQEAEQGFTFNSTTFSQTDGPWSSAGQQAIDGSGNFSDVVDGVGRALTGRFQQLEDTVAVGTSLRSEAVIVVRWAWIAYPLALVVLGLGGLLLTILATHTKHMAVWKESTLPILYRFGGPSHEMPDPGFGTASAHMPAQAPGQERGHGQENWPLGPGPDGHHPPPLTPSFPIKFSNTIPVKDSNRVSSIVTQAADEQVQLRRRGTVWVLDSAPREAEHEAVKHETDRDRDKEKFRSKAKPKTKSWFRGRLRSEDANATQTQTVVPVPVHRPGQEGTWI
ncbi:uncharacterized protein Z518_10134 [Rhinocladiella mackenziei CBS 650.93]|uniref:Uncharacterized protein n=1 Tax=Rhinocladiella mackenziei CBS 650.93 TaxID=1442369 RepID=A0A0D2GS02_9EURO|nr:uncharacterized protein Z518_10134 [Rhinocladiella mackenziei CBS 650.93]KIX01068.1 hypothetical protein Z518_10134 [Rhinocladiella mackenziei CBS 650.93]